MRLSDPDTCPSCLLLRQHRETSLQDTGYVYTGAGWSVTSKAAYNRGSLVSMCRKSLGGQSVGPVVSGGRITVVSALHQQLRAVEGQHSQRAGSDVDRAGHGLQDRLLLPANAFTQLTQACSGNWDSLKVEEPENEEQPDMVKGMGMRRGRRLLAMVRSSSVQ